MDSLPGLQIGPAGSPLIPGRLGLKELPGFGVRSQFLCVPVVELEAVEGSQITRKPLASLASLIAGKIIVGSVYRDGSWQTAMGDTHILPGEKVVAICGSDDLKNLRKLFLT